MAKGMSVHIGLNSVDPACYGGWVGTLVACEKDARDMEAIARARGFEAKTLLTSQATSDNFRAAIESAASKLEKDDILFVTYSGHGGQVDDKNNDEVDAKDETWCFFDRQVIDDELFGLWSKLAAGVRVIVLSDSCHSGSVIRDIVRSLPESLKREWKVSADLRLRGMPKEIAAADSERRRSMYEQIQARNPKGLQDEVKASVLLISGCQDNQTSEDGDDNGRFTAALRSVYKNGQFSGNYRAFYGKIRDNMPVWQSPNFVWTGVRSTAFEKQQPFAI